MTVHNGGLFTFYKVLHEEIINTFPNAHQPQKRAEKTLPFCLFQPVRELLHNHILVRELTVIECLLVLSFRIEI